MKIISPIKNLKLAFRSVAFQAKLKLFILCSIGFVFTQNMQAQRFLFSDKDTTQKTFQLPESLVSDPIAIPDWQLKPERYPHLRSPLIKDPETMLLNWRNRLDFLKNRPLDPKEAAFAETNRRFLEYLEMERYKKMPAYEKLRARVGSWAPALDALAFLVGMQMGALRGYTYGADFRLQVAPRSLYASESMEERFQRNAYGDPKTMAFYKQFLWMETTGWTRPADAMPTASPNK